MYFLGSFLFLYKFFNCFHLKKNLHIIDKNEWFWPKLNGEMPVARAAHAAVATGDCAYIFGGRHMNKRLNDLHCLHLPTHTWKTK